METLASSPSRTSGLLKALLLATALLALCHTFAWANDYKDGLKRARSEDKTVLLYFFSQYCGYCNAMDRDVLADKEVAASLKSDLVYVRVDADIRRDLARQYGIRGYPTTVLLDPSGKSIVRIPGYLGKKEIRLVMDYAKAKAYKSVSLRDYLKKRGFAVD